MNRKGITDTFWFTGMFFAVAVLTIALTLANAEFNTAIQADSSISSDVKDTVQDFNDKVPSAFDSGLVLAYLAAHIGIVFLGLLLRSHPMLFMFLMIGLLAVSLLAGYNSNAYNEIAGEASLQTYADSYPMVSWILDNYIIVTLLFGFLDIIAFLGISALIDRGGGI